MTTLKTTSKTLVCSLTLSAVLFGASTASAGSEEYLSVIADGYSTEYDSLAVQIPAGASGFADLWVDAFAGGGHASSQASFSGSGVSESISSSATGGSNFDGDTAVVSNLGAGTYYLNVSADASGDNASALADIYVEWD